MMDAVRIRIMVETLVWSDGDDAAKRRGAHRSYTE